MTAVARFLRAGVAAQFFLSILLISPWLHAQEEEDYKILRQIVLNEFEKQAPQEQGTDLAGVMRRFPEKGKKAAIILEACLEAGPQIDEDLLRQLQERKIPSALFTDQGWLVKNSAAMNAAMVSGLLQVENHGLFCRPLSANGKGIKDHAGTAKVDEVFEEVEKNARVIEKTTGRLPRFYKSGYGYYDDVTLKIVTVLGYTPVEGDLKLRASDVATDIALNAFLEKIQPGSIIVMPVNRPGKSNDWLPKILDGIIRHGYQLVALDDVIGGEEENQ